MRPAAQWLSFASPKESHQRKGDPAVCDPFAALRGNLGCSVTGCTAELAARLRRSAQTAAVSQFTKRVCPSAHAPPRALRAPGASRREPEGHPHGPLLRCAALGTVSRAQAPRAAQTGPSAAMARMDVRLLGCSAPHPCWLRLRRGGCGVSMGVAAPMPRELTRRGCLNEAAPQRSEFHGAPRNRPDAGLPLRTAKGSQTGGRLFFGDFLLAKQKKVTRTPGDSRPPPSTKTHHPISGRNQTLQNR